MKQHRPDEAFPSLWPEQWETEEVPPVDATVYRLAKGSTVINLCEKKEWDAMLQGAFLSGAVILVTTHGGKPLRAFKRRVMVGR
ncbi:MAG: hypothetical protein ABI565_07805 [Vicinamibacteria bacterium]